jgi:hypothetical protein
MESKRLSLAGKFSNLNFILFSNLYLPIQAKTALATFPTPD